MAVAVAPYRFDPFESALQSRQSSTSKTGLAEWQHSINTLAPISRRPPTHSPIIEASWTLEDTCDVLIAFLETVGILNICAGTVACFLRLPELLPLLAPPNSSRDDTASELPPDHITNTALAHAQTERPLVAYHPAPLPWKTTGKHGAALNCFSYQPNIDFTTPANCREHAKKKDKKAAQAAQRNKWQDDSGGEKNDTGEGCDQDGNGGAGGDGGHGGGEDEDEDWETSNNKKGKKSKQKTAFSWDALEDENDKNDEEGGNANAADANPDDGWGLATLGKKKKGKKGSPADPDPPPPPRVPALNMHFDDMNQGGDAASLLDLDLGTSGTEPKSSGFNFGSWGGGWGTTASKWDFGGAGIAGVENKAAETRVEDITTNEDAWGEFGKKGKAKKSTGFDFDFDNLDGAATVADTLPAVAIVIDPEPAAEDVWGSWGATKDKKKMKKGVEPEIIDVAPPLPTVTVPPVEDASWAGFSTGKNKKGKKVKDKPAPNAAIILVPEPDPVTAETAADDDWGGWGMFSMDKKKKAARAAKATGNEGITPPSEIISVPEPASCEPEAAQADDFDSWNTTSKKDKKKKKNGFADLDPHVKVAPTEPAFIVISAEPAADDWPSSGWNDTGKKGNGKKGALEEPAPPPPPHPPLAAPEPVASVGDSSWSFGWGQSSKDKKKGTKVDSEPVPPPPPPEPIVLPHTVEEAEAEDNGWAGTWSTGTKKKDKKKVKIFGIVDVVESISAEIPVQHPDSTTDKAGDEDVWGTWGRKDRTKAKKGFDGPPPSVPTPPKQAPLDPGEPATNDLWNTSTSKKDKLGKKTATRDSTPPKATKGDAKIENTSTRDAQVFSSTTFGKESNLDVKDKKDAPKTSSGWGMWGSNTAPNPTSKDKEGKPKKDEAQRQADEAAFAAALADNAVEMLDDTNNKTGKNKAHDKALKSDSKPSVGKKVKDPSPEPPTVSKPALVKPTKADGWNLWGTPAAGGTREIPLKSTPNHTSTLKAGLQKTLEANLADEHSHNATGSSRPKTSSTSMVATNAKGSVADRIKALQGDAGINAKNDKDKNKKAMSPAQASESVVVDEVSKKSSSKDKRSGTSKILPSKMDKGFSPPVAFNIGGFPTDDFVDMPSTKKASKDSKPSKYTAKDIKPVRSDAPQHISGAFDNPLNLTGKIANPEKASKTEKVLKTDKMSTERVLKVEKATRTDKPSKTDTKSSKLPAPPLEPNRQSVPAKKERPKVVRDQGSSSWGFWGAAPRAEPRKDRSPKEVERKASSAAREKSAQSSRPELGRSKSARTAHEKDPREKHGNSSDPDKAANKASRDRPSTSRGMSLSGMFGMGPPSTRSKSMRHSTSAVPRSTTRNVDTGISPPLVDGVSAKKVSPKAAKVMGLGKPSMGRKGSVRDKTFTGPPDPYAIDSDTLMADGAWAAKNAIPAESKRRKDVSSTTRTKRDSAFMSGGLGPAPDARPMDTPPAESLAFDVGKDERPAIKRSASSAKKSTGLMGMFGGLGRKDPDEERRRSRVQDDDNEARRLRRESRKVARPQEVSGADNPAEHSDTEDAEARRAERKARRAEREAAEAAAGEERASRRRAERKEGEALAKKKEEQREMKKQDEKRVRRAAREARYAEEEQERRAADDRDAERRARRQEEHRSDERPKTSDRTRSYHDGADKDDDAERRARREERRLRRSDTQIPDKGRPHTSRRRTDHPDDYFSSKHDRHAPKPDGRPYLHRGSDKTSSWVASVNDEPPPPPPVSATIVDAPAVETAGDVGMDETTARELRRNRRRQTTTTTTHDVSDEDAQQRRRRRREGDAAVKSSDDGADRRGGGGGGGGGRVYNSMGYADMGGKQTWDGYRGAENGAGRRASWFKKLAGF